MIRLFFFFSLVLLPACSFRLVGMANPQNMPEQGTTMPLNLPEQAEISIIAPILRDMPEKTEIVPNKAISVNPSDLPRIQGDKAIAGNLGKEISNKLDDYIKPTLIRYPMYDYKLGKQWFMSKTEKIIADAYIKTNNVAEACRALNAIRGAHGSNRFHSINGVRAWLQRPHVAKYIGDAFQDQGKVNWFDVTKWKAWAIDVQMGVIPATQVQVAIHKEYGKAQGWYVETGPQVQTNMQINFVQSDGKA